MEPIPETATLIAELSDHSGTDLLADLQRKAEAVKVLVPELVGLSLAAMTDGVAFTLVATEADIAVLDAIQYALGGPCVDAARAERVIVHDTGAPDDEGHWQSFARATAARAIATTLTLPVLDAAATVIGTVNLYAATSGAFRGQHREIAEIFSAWAPGAVTNADLSFRTRRAAQDAPRKHRAAMRVEAAVGMLMAARSVDARTARALLEEAAQRAGVTTEQLAESMLESSESDDES